MEFLKLLTSLWWKFVPENGSRSISNTKETCYTSIKVLLICRQKVPKRQGCARVKLTGMFEGAKVVRGPDWRWEDQDGKRNA